jgi:hypothetical protein
MTDTPAGGESSGSGSSGETSSGGSGSETLGKRQRTGDSHPSCAVCGRAVRRPTDGAPTAPWPIREPCASAVRQRPAQQCACMTAGSWSPPPRRMQAARGPPPPPISPMGRTATRQRFTDSSGNTSATSTVREVAVDATAPVASPVAAVRRADGAAIDARTNSRSAALSGTAEAGAIVRGL